jgi:hypothetical protein
MSLGEQQTGQPLLEGRLRHESADEIGRPLMRGALQPAIRLALEPAIGRIRGAGVESCDLECPGVGPAAVPVPVKQERGPAGRQPVQQVPARRPARKPFHPPAASRDPLLVRMRRDVGLDPADGLVQRRRPDQVATDHRHTREGGVHVGVLKARKERPPAHIDALGGRPLQLGDRFAGLRAESDDSPLRDGDGARGAPIRCGGPDQASATRIGRVDRAAIEDHVRVPRHVPSCRAFADPIIIARCHT